MKKKLTYKELSEENLRLKEQLKKAENCTKEKAFLDALLKNIPNAIYFKDKKSKFVKVSNSILKAFGVEKMEDLIGKSDFDFFKKESAQQYFDEEQKIIKTGKAIINREHIERRKNGKNTWAIISKVPLKDKKGEIIGTFGISSDITQRKEATQTIKENELKLKELNATKDKFFSIIAHDLKSPFNALLGFSELLLNSFEQCDIDQQKEFAQIIHQSIKNTQQLLENLLMWALSQRGKIKFNPQKENVYNIADKSITHLKQAAANKSISITNNINKNYFAFADKNMLATIIRNLVNNAIKFTHKNGKIEVNANELEENNKEYIKITIKDNGIGIPLEIQEKLFLITENTSTEGTEDEAGTGLGLILCKEFVEKQGGRIWVKSKINIGSEFYFTIPK